MARRFNGSSWFSRNYTLAVVNPYALAAWVRFNAPPVNGTIIGVGSSTFTGLNWRYQLGVFNGQFALDYSNSRITHPAPITVGDWIHLFGQIVSTNGRGIFVNGVTQAGGNTGGIGPPASYDRLSIGNNISDGVWQTGIIADIAFPAFWQGGPISVPMLYAKAHPFIATRANNAALNWLHSCLDFSGDSSPMPDRVSRIPWDITGAPTETDNPIMYFHQ